MSEAVQVADVEESNKNQKIILKCKPVSALVPQPIPIIDLTELDDSETEAEDVKNIQQADETKQKQDNAKNEEERKKSINTLNQGVGAENYASNVGEENTGGKKAQQGKEDENRENQEGVDHVQEFWNEKESVVGAEALQETEKFDERPSLEDPVDEEYDKLEYEDVYSDLESEHD